MTSEAKTTAQEQIQIKAPQFRPAKINQVIFPKSSVWERMKLYPKTLTTKRSKIALVVFIIPGLILLPVKASYNILRKTWDYSCDFFAILTNLK